MEWIIGIVVVLIVLGVMSRRRNEKPEPRPSQGPKLQPSEAPPRAQAGRARQAYATIFENNEHRPVTSDQVAEMFAGIRSRLKEHRRAAKAMQKLADKFWETGKLDDAAYAALAHAENDARGTLAEAESLNDRLYFNSDSAIERYYKFVDDLTGAEIDIESAREDIANTQRLIDVGDFVPHKRLKAKAVKRPPKGSQPNIRMRYRSMSDNESEWKILVVSRHGKSFVGWSFERDQEFQFNVAGIIWAEDMATRQRVTNFEVYLDDLFPKPRAQR